MAAQGFRPVASGFRQVRKPVAAPADARQQMAVATEGAMKRRDNYNVFEPKSRNRLLLLPAVLLGLLVAMPWLIQFLETRLLPAGFRHLTELIDSLITALLGIWILTMIGREQEINRTHLEELEQLSLTDPLTGLGNRRAFERDLEVALSRAQRTDLALTLLYLDVDEMKRVNDRFGHVVGDETLRALGAVLRSSSRLGTDSAYRVGGDEFVMVIAADASAAETIAGRVASSFTERSPRNSHVSTGVVTWDGQTRLQQLLDEADTRMYRHKHPRFKVAPA